MHSAHVSPQPHFQNANFATDLSKKKKKINSIDFFRKICCDTIVDGNRLKAPPSPETARKKETVDL
jgi:hypothetical protein